MAKKKKQTIEEPIVEETVVIEEQPKVEAPKVKAKPKNNWVIEDKVYYLKGRMKPLSRSIKSSGIYYFDEKLGYERELKYCENQRTPFVDEMKGDQRLSHVIFRNGALYVEKTKTVLQKLLSLYHPDKDKIYYEFQPVQEAANEIERLELEADAILAARNMDIDMA